VAGRLLVIGVEWPAMSKRQRAEWLPRMP